MIAEVVFGEHESGVHLSREKLQVKVNLRLLHGCDTMQLAVSDTFISRQSGVVQCVQNEEILIGAASMTVSGVPQNAASQIYKDLLQALGDFNLVRIWNYVPGINQHGPELENYQSFCMGRAEQFSCTGLPLPAASAVGVDGDKLVVAFVATRHPVAYWENPEQIPAYQYPIQYGPRSPSFSRASEVRTANQTGVYISGTASIKGHLSVHVGNLEQQWNTTLDNIRIMKETVLASEIGRLGTSFLEETCIYLRREEDLDSVLGLLDQSPETTQRLTILKSDICRADLLIEIETHQPLR